MKALLLSALIGALSITSHHRQAHAASVQELCVNGKVTSTTTPAQGPAIGITSCEWAGTTTITVPTTATSLVVSGGTTLGVITINFGTPANPMTIAFTNKFTASYRVILKGELKAGSSVSITDCSFPVRQNNYFNFGPLTLIGADFVFSRNLVTFYSDSQGLQIPSCSAACTYTVDDNLFNYTTFNTLNAILLSNGQSPYHSITFTSRRNKFLVANSSLTAGTGFLISTVSVVSKLAPETLPSDWSLVTREEARNTYGKNTFVIADNVFQNFTSPWSITDQDGADFTIENNTMSGVSMITPAYTSNGNYYRFLSVIRNNTLTNTGNANAYIELAATALPANSSVLIQNNTVTAGGADPCIVYLRRATIYNASAFVEISGNVLLSSTGLTGLQGGTVRAIYSSHVYTRNQESLIAVSAPIWLFDNTLFGVPIDTHELTLSTVRFANSSRMPKIDSPYPKPTTTSTTQPTTSTAAPTTTSAAPTTSTAAATTTAAPTTTTAAATTTAAPTTTTTTAAPTTTSAAPTTTTVAPTTTFFSVSATQCPFAASAWATLVGLCTLFCLMAN